MEPYLTEDEAVDLLFDTYTITATITPGDVQEASADLDHGSYIGSRFASSQALQFPRDVTLDGDTEGEVPERVLLWVALRSHQLSAEDDPAVISESAGRVSVTYARPKVSQTERRMRKLIAPYKVAVRIR